jgi:mitochondrial fission protein ELM1
MLRDGGADTPVCVSPNKADKSVCPTVRVVIASDGKRGHENQSRVLARMLGDTEPLIMHLRNPEGGLAERLLRARFALLGPPSLSQRETAALVRTHLKPESPDEFRDFATDIGKHRANYRVFTVSTGTPPATMNLLLARLLDAEPLCVMTPSMLPRKLFRLQIVPQHDVGGKAPENVVTHPLALSYFDQQRAEHIASIVLKESKLGSGTNFLAFAIGNISAWPDPIEEVFTAVREIALKHSYKLLLTTSRRTSPLHMNLLKEFVTDKNPGLVAHLVDAAVNPLNPLPGYYELAERVLVTGDSFSMVCESIQAGHQPVVDVRQSSAKLRRSLKLLAAGGLIQSLDTSKFAGNVGLLTGYPARWAGTPGRIFEPNQFYNQLRNEIRARLGLD